MGWIPLNRLSPPTENFLEAAALPPTVATLPTPGLGSLESSRSVGRGFLVMSSPRVVVVKRGQVCEWVRFSLP